MEIYFIRNCSFYKSQFWLGEIYLNDLFNRNRYKKDSAYPIY